MLYWLGRLTIRCFLKVFFNLEVLGQEIFPSQGAFILASNHPSHFDPPLLAGVVKRRISFLAKEELFCNRIARVFFQELGAIPVKRHASDFKAMRQALAVLKKKPLLIFPQGLVGAPWDQANAGVGFLAKKSGVPLIVARIDGSEQIFPITSSLGKRKTIKVIFDRMEDIDSCATNQAIATQVMAKIKSL